MLLISKEARCIFVFSPDSQRQRKTTGKKLEKSVLPVWLLLQFRCCKTSLSTVSLGLQAPTVPSPLRCAPMLELNVKTERHS